MRTVVSKSATLASNPVNTHSVTHGGETVECNSDSFESVCDALIKKHGPGIPKVVELNTVPVRLVPPTPTPASHNDDSISAIGLARASRDAALALEGGFVLAEPHFALGTKVNSLGVENAQRSQIDHEQKPFAQEMCVELRQKVFAEDRRDFEPRRLSHMTLTNDGCLRVGNGVALPITKRIFGTLMGKFPCSSGIAYLNDCPPELRATNFNTWSGILANTEDQSKPTEVVLRTRMMHGQRVAYAAVSPRYTAFDCDTIAEALSIAFPSDARGTVDYDGERVRVEGMWHSDVEAIDYVAGEIFKAGVVIRSDDTGAGSIQVKSVIWRNLCRNLIILDKAIGVDVRIRHTGSVHELAREFRKAFSQALTSVNPFRVAWTNAMHERDAALVSRVQGTTSENLGAMSPEAVLPGVFNGIIERDLVPVRGRAEAIVPKLLQMHTADEAATAYGVSRASIVNAFTRYAHEVETDPFHADLIRAGAGALLSGQKGHPAPLPYVGLR